MEKKKIDVKFIVGMIILLLIFGVVGGSFWNMVARQAEKDRQEEVRLDQEAIRAICVEVGDILKSMVFVDMDKKTVFSAEVPKKGIYNQKDVLIAGDTLVNGDMVKIYGDGNMTRSIPAQYPDVTKMKRIGRATLEELQPYLEIAKELHQPEIFLGDLVQEGSVGLMIGLSQQIEAEEELLQMARENMQSLLEVQSEVKIQDRKMADKVNDLDEKIKEVTEQMGRKVSVEELAQLLEITEEEIEDIVRLAGEDLEEEKPTES